MDALYALYALWREAPYEPICFSYLLNLGVWGLGAANNIPWDGVDRVVARGSGVHNN